MIHPPGKILHRAKGVDGKVVSTRKEMMGGWRIPPGEVLHPVIRERHHGKWGAEK